MKRLAVIAAMLGLLCSPASAAEVDPSRDTLVGGARVSESLRIAKDFWRGEPHCSVIRVYYTSPGRLYEMFGQAAVAAAAPAPLDRPAQACPIWVSNRLARNSYVHRISMCTTLVHEYGHVMHFYHDDIRDSIMNVDQRDWDVYACYKRFLPRGKGREWRDRHPNRVWARAPW